MPTRSQALATKERVEKHREEHRLVQSWVSPALHAKLKEMAKAERRSLANFVRGELGKIAGVPE